MTDETPDATSGDGVRGKDRAAKTDQDATEPDDDGPEADSINDGPDVEPEIEPNGISQG